LIDELEMKVWT